MSVFVTDNSLHQSHKAIPESITEVVPSAHRSHMELSGLFFFPF